MTTQNKQLVSNLQQVKETKHMLQFEADWDGSEEPMAVSSVYIPKWAVARLGNPTKITITVEAR